MGKIEFFLPKLCEENKVVKMCQEDTISIMRAMLDLIYEIDQCIVQTFDWERLDQQIQIAKILCEQITDPNLRNEFFSLLNQYEY